MKIKVRTIAEHFPASVVEEGEYKLYPLGYNGISKGENVCLKIE